MSRVAKLKSSDYRLLKEILKEFPASSRFSIDKFIYDIPDIKLRRCFRKGKNVSIDVEKILLKSSIDDIKYYLVDNDFILYAGSITAMPVFSTHFAEPEYNFYALTDRGKKLKTTGGIRNLKVIEWGNVWGIGFSILFLILNFILTIINILIRLKM